jgi:hypothetical protein
VTAARAPGILLRMLAGIHGRPFIDLEPLLDLGALDEVHDEICVGLANVPVDYTGGSHRTMGIMPASREAEAVIDYGEVIRALGDRDFATLRELSDAPDDLDPSSRDIGEERDVPLSRRQMLWLKYRFGVYFPWKVYFEMIPNQFWHEKSSSDGKDFTRLAKTFFPKTIALVRSLPFERVGRCNLMGLEANDHGTVHRDGVPEEKPDVDHFISISPTGDKRLFLWDEAAREKTPVTGRAYWFNDSDYHGVDPSPRFQYSIRVDGVFTPDFIERVRAAIG